MDHYTQSTDVGVSAPREHCTVWAPGHPLVHHHNYTSTVLECMDRPGPSIPACATVTLCTPVCGIALVGVYLWSTCAILGSVPIDVKFMSYIVPVFINIYLVF